MRLMQQPRPQLQTHALTRQISELWSTCNMNHPKTQQKNTNSLGQRSTWLSMSLWEPIMARASLMSNFHLALDPSTFAFTSSNQNLHTLHIALSACCEIATASQQQESIDKLAAAKVRKSTGDKDIVDMLASF